MRMRDSALVASSLLLIGGCTTATEPPAPRAEPTSSHAGPTTSSSTSPEASTGSGGQLPDTLPVSGPPRLPYVSGAVLRRPDGSRLRLDLRMRGRWGVTSVVPAPGGGYLVTDDRWFEGTVGMRRLDSDGAAVDAWASTGPALLGPGREVAWTRVPVPEAMQSWPARLHVDDRVQDLAGHHQPRILQFDGALVVYEATILRPRRARRTFETAVPGAARPVARGLRERSRSLDREHWWRWVRGALVLGQGETAVVRLRDRSLGQVLAEPVWEDGRHLLVTLVRRGRQALVRVGVDGSVTRTTGWVRASPAGHAVMPGAGR